MSDDARELRRRFLGFTLLPALAAVSPLLVLPAVSRIAGADGWASAIAGEAVGTFAAIAIAYGWTTVGPSLVSVAQDDAARGRLYREAVVVRLCTAAVALPVMIWICSVIAFPGHEALAILMGAQGALIALSFTWFSVGIGDPRAILTYDAVPRLVAAVATLPLVITYSAVELYPIAGILVTLIGTILYTRRVLSRYRSTWPSLRALPGLFRMGAPVAVNDAALGAYSAVPTPLVSVLSSGSIAAGFASADKLAKLGQFLPITLANALQNWTGEGSNQTRARRVTTALTVHSVFGVVGWAVLALLGPWASSLLFGSQAAASFAVCFALGLAFAMYSARASMTRHVLYPTGGASTVMRATVIATVIGVPAMIGAGVAAGPVAVAAGYALTEAISTVLLIRPTRRAVALLAMGEGRS